MARRALNVVELTSIALLIHEYQYNRPDPMGVVSRIPSDETARQVISSFIARVREVIMHNEG